MILKLIRRVLVGVGFVNIYVPLVFGDKRRLHLHKSVKPVNTLFNVVSGDIFVDEGSFFGHNCMVLTGRHHREPGKDMQVVVPVSGYDIHIGKRCWIASGAIILGGVTIGDDITVAAGAIVTKNIPSGSFVKGVC